MFGQTDGTRNQAIIRPKTICFFLFLVLLTFFYGLSNSFFAASANYKRIDIRRHSFASLKHCFNYKNCHLNEKFKIFFLGQTDDKWNEYEDIVEIAHEVDQACIVLFFVREQKDLFFLENFLRQSEEANMNLLIIDVARKPLGFSYDQIHRYFSNGSITNNNEYIKFREYIKCSLIASYNAPRDDSTRNNNLNIHFSVTDLPRFDMDVLNLSENFLFLSSKRHYLLTYHHHNILGKMSLKTTEIIDLIAKVFTSYSINFIINLKCKRDTSFKTLDLCFNRFTRAKFLINSTFSLILNENNDGLRFWSLDNTIRLVECLRVGTIPVLINQDIQLPLSELIAWDEVIIYLPKTHISRIDTFLQDINEAEVIKRRMKAHDVYKAYFMDSKTQFRTLITVLRQRLKLSPLQFSPLNSSLYMAIESKIKYKFDSVDKPGVIQNKIKNLSRNSFVSQFFSMGSYSKWNRYYYPFKIFPSQPNQPFLPNNVRYSINLDNYKLIYENEDQTDIDFENGIHGGTYTRRQFSRNLGGNFDDEEFTIVFYSFKREKKLISILTKYLHLKFLNRIILIWNRNSTRPSNLFLNKFRRELNIKKNIVLTSNVNRNLNKRFLPYDMIQTDAVLNINDEAHLTDEAIALGFRVWRENRDQLVGFAPRGHSWHVKSQQYMFRTYFNCEYSMVLTTAVFYHRFYNYQYTYMLDKRIKDKIYDFDNCDDIAFNYMVSSLLRKPPIKVSSISFQACQNCGNIDQTRFLARKKSVFSQRHECLNYFNRVFGYNPLLYSQYRVNSVSFQTKHHGKCFKTL